MTDAYTREYDKQKREASCRPTTMATLSLRRRSPRSDAFGTALPTPFTGRADSSDVRSGDVEAAAPRLGRTPEWEKIRRRKEFIRLLNDGVDPLTASQRSGYPADKALAMLSELGFVLTVLEPEPEKRAA